MIPERSVFIFLIFMLGISFYSCQKKNCQSNPFIVQNKFPIQIQKFSFAKHPDTLQYSNLCNLLQVLNSSEIKIDTLYNIIQSKEYMIEELEWLNDKFNTDLFLETKYLELVTIKLRSGDSYFEKAKKEFSSIRIMNFHIKKGENIALDRKIKEKIIEDNDRTIDEYKYIPFEDNFVLIFFFRTTDIITQRTFDKIYEKCVEESKTDRK